jgi:polysaccharide export outer membrane protein
VAESSQMQKLVAVHRVLPKTTHFPGQLVYHYKEKVSHGWGGEAVVRRLLNCVAGLAILMVLVGCSGMGPLGLDVKNVVLSHEGQPYVFIKLSPDVTKVLARFAPRLVGEFRDQRRPVSLQFGIGDVVSVTIFEAASGGLFVPAEAGVRPGNFVSLPTQSVDNDGNISVPYAGSIRAAGRTKMQLQNAIVEALKNRAIEPQVVVSTITQQTSLITLVGDVRAPGRIPAFAAGERLIDTISRAGGTLAPADEEWVMLERGGRRALSPFGALLYESVNNIWTHPGDTIFVYREPQTFLSFGAIDQRQIPFGTWRISLSEAIAKAGGLQEVAADPTSVFLYRGETREALEAMGYDISQFKGPIIPVVYNLNLRDPSGYFLASSFEMRNKDVLYVATAPAVEMAKFRAYMGTIYGTATDPMQAAITAYTLKNISMGTGAVSILGGTTVPAAAPAPVPAAGP